MKRKVEKYPLKWIRQTLQTLLKPITTYVLVVLLAMLAVKAYAAPVTITLQDGNNGYSGTRDAYPYGYSGMQNGNHGSESGMYENITRH